MFLTRLQLFFATILLHIVLPIMLLAAFWVLGKENLVSTIVLTLLIGNSILLLLKTGAWEFANYYIRYIMVFAFCIIAFRNLIFTDYSMQNISSTQLSISILLACLSLVLIYLNMKVFCSQMTPPNCLNLSFPFKDGFYMITDGGDGKISSLSNYHYTAQVHKNGKSNTSMRFATDITKLNPLGFTVKNILLGENEQYEIFHQNVYSPCDATVVDVVNGIKNNIPFSRKFPYNVGNCVTLKYDTYYIVMGHLQENSILVSAGDNVKSGDLLGIIGNSGLTPRPHLHIQVSKCEDGLYWSGEGVPIFFKDLGYPIKNKAMKI